MPADRGTYTLSSWVVKIIFCALPLSTSSKYKQVYSTAIHAVCSSIIFMKHLLFFSFTERKPTPALGQVAPLDVSLETDSESEYKESC